MEHLRRIEDHYNEVADQRLGWRNKNSYYYTQLTSLYQFLIPKNKKILELGSATGDLLASLHPIKGLGIDLSSKLVGISKKRFPSVKKKQSFGKVRFLKGDAHALKIQEKFDYVILSDLIGDLSDIQRVFEELHKVSSPNTRIVINYYNFLWEPFLRLAEKLKMKMPQPQQNWLSSKDIENLLFLSNLEVVKKGNCILFPFYIPIISTVLNKYIAKLPLIKNLCLVQYFVVRINPKLFADKDYSVSVIIPARNEAGNIEPAVLRTPQLGSQMEIIFVEGNSKDNTLEEIKRVIQKYKGVRDIKLVQQGKGIGKGDAVRKGFEAASKDVLMILDADLTTTPEDMPKFYNAIRERKGELVMGSRLVYPLEKDAMRILNIFGNKFFSLAFSFLLDQPIKDTLNGTKVLFKRDYQDISENRSYFGDFDPFGDFDLIFGASKMNLKIMEIPIRYKARTYGETNISRFKHGLLLLKMVIFASRKIKFI